eukprot:CAMPEP_0181026074 /NCGR_PEP_ID=MMETSP1070-20121207/3442_1 /TAXON_ID=265543 /ORGANISM="Minutocellus polymorphus, Strain NH13" /LENGTH=273 /DNA_ID=CAMNT_0023103235 /DNA_START=22 /DNA_END=843 /DNA_ORIENTATION=+
MAQTPDQIATSYIALGVILNVLAALSIWSTNIVFVDAFSPTPRSINSIRSSHSRKTQLHSSSLGDLLSGITGQAPASLNYPADVLEGTNIDPSRSSIDLQCVYKASRDGWSAINFHESVDGRGSALVVVLSKSGKKFGGYNPLGWQSTDDYGASNAAFLWYDKGGSAVACPVLSGGNAAIFDYATGGPNFGAADLVIGRPQAAVLGGFAGPDAEDISVAAGNLREGSSSAGGAYDVPNGWPVRGKFGVVEIEVYCNANVKPTGGGGGFSLWPF